VAPAGGFGLEQNPNNYHQNWQKLAILGYRTTKKPQKPAIFAILRQLFAYQLTINDGCNGARILQRNRNRTGGA